MSETETDPYVIAMRALRDHQAERARLVTSAFLWSIPLAAVMSAVAIGLIRWLV